MPRIYKQWRMTGLLQGWMLVFYHLVRTTGPINRRCKEDNYRCSLCPRGEGLLSKRNGRNQSWEVERREPNQLSTPHLHKEACNTILALRIRGILRCKISEVKEIIFHLPSVTLAQLRKQLQTRSITPAKGDMPEFTSSRSWTSCSVPWSPLPQPFSLSSLTGLTVRYCSLGQNKSGKANSQDASSLHPFSL